MAELFNQGYALLIGVGECVDPTLSLSVTVQDMKALRQILVDPALCAYPDNDQHIQLLHDQTATKSGILDSLAQLRDRVATDPEATVIVYYSGHGWLEQSTDGYYLIPHDFDRYEWRTTALSATDFNQALQSIKAKRFLVILDCCHAAGIGTAKDTTSLPLPKGVVPSTDPKGILDALTQGEGRVVFTSCRGEEQSWVRQDKTLSVYTHHLIEALQGAASQAGTTEVTIFDLANHLGKSVPATAATMNQKQTPRFEMRDTERFAIALLQGGKGLSSGGWRATQPIAPASGNQTQVSAVGERSVAIGGNAQGAVIVTGDSNVVRKTNVAQQGKTNLNIESASGFHIGDIYTTAQPSTPNPSVPAKTILVLAANPMNSTRLALDKEISEIEKSLRRSTNRDGFKLVSRLAVGTQDLRQALLEIEPQIIHFCGHGSSSSESSAVPGSRKLNAVHEEADEGGIFLQDDSGKAQLVTGKALTSLLSLFDKHLECVILNSCYSSAQADLIKQRIPIVIGMKQAIGDKAAIEFSRGFYDALGAGRTIDKAFEFGCNAIDLENIPEHLTPVIRYRDRPDEG
jgi:Caspase domain/CHAT domain